MTYQDIIKNIKILLVDDDVDYLNMTSTFFKQMGYNVDIAENGTKALEMLSKNNYQILLLDFYMPDMTGEDVITKLRKFNQEIIIILQTGFSGQNPPAEMLKKLNIQNYFDKTEGISRLELEVISAVRIVVQQNKIELTKYKNSAMGDLMTSIAEEIKQVLLSVSASIETVGILMNNTEKMEKIFEKNKESLQNLDKILTSILSSSNSENVLYANDFMTVVSAIANNIAKKKNVMFNSKIALKDSKYIVGLVNDIVFINCAILKEVILASNANDNVDFVITDDEESWYFSITSSNIDSIDKTKLINVNNVITAIKNLDADYSDNCITLKLKKDDKQ